MTLVKIVHINNDKQILSGQRDPNDKLYPKMWDLPGGNVNDGETPIEACLREAHEELGIDLDIADLEHIGFIDFINTKVWIYILDVLPEKLRPDMSDEFTEIKYLELGEFIQNLRDNSVPETTVTQLEALISKYL